MIYFTKIVDEKRDDEVVDERDDEDVEERDDEVVDERDDEDVEERDDEIVEGTRPEINRPSINATMKQSGSRKQWRSCGEPDPKMFCQTG